MKGNFNSVGCKINFRGKKLIHSGSTVIESMYLVTIWCYMIMLAMTLAVGGTKTSSDLISPTPSSIVDILSSQVQYSYFLRQLQRQGLIPLINSLENVTILAPVNSAFVDGPIETDSQLLLRYIINQRVRVGWLGYDEVIYSTYYQLNDHDNYTVSVVPNLENKEYVIDNVSAIIDWDNYAKNQYSFIQGIEKLLPLKPDLCDVLLNKQPTLINGNDITFIKMLFQSVLTKKSCQKYLDNTRTLFIPTNDYIIKTLSPMQQQYYLSLYDILLTNDFITTTTEAKQEFTNDIFNLLDYLKLSPLIVGINGTANVTYEGFKQNKFHLQLQNHSVLVNDVESVANMVMSNGVIHVFDKNQDQPDFLNALNVPIVKMIPRKVLNALHFSKFSKELYFRNLEYLIDGSTPDLSLFLDINNRDDIQEELMLMSTKSRLEPQGFSNKQNILYQFGEFINITKENEKTTEVYKLIPSRLCSKKKIGGCFDLKVASTKLNNGYYSTLNDDLEIIDGPIDMGNHSILYIVDSDIAAPISLKHALGDVMSSGSVPRHIDHLAIDKQSCLVTLELLNKFKLLSVPDNNQGYSIFLPCASHSKNQAKNNWEDLGLIYNYLKSNSKLLKEIMKGMFIQDVIYTDSEHSRTTINLNGDSIEVNSVQNSHHNNGVIKLNNTKLEVQRNSDILFNQGVIHLIDKVLLPDYFRVPFIDLINTTIDESYHHHSILNLIELYPKIQQALGLSGHTSNPYSLLIPSSEALQEFNITTNYRKLLEFLEFHLIPNDQLGKLLTCMGEDHYNQNISDIRTNLTKTSLTCYQSKSGNRFLKLVEPVAKLTRLDALSYNKDREVKIINYGCTQVRHDRKSGEDMQCVFLLEKPLNLQWLQPKDNFSHVHLGFISLGIGIIFGLLIFGTVMFLIILCVGKDEKQLNKVSFEENLPNNEPHFMRVRLDNDEFPVHDRGYDTDIDVLRDNDEFLPLYGTKKIYKKRDYGSTQNQDRSSNNNRSIRPGTSPRNIRNFISTFSRDRNLPSQT